MPVFVVERYIPRLSAEGVEAQVRAEEALASSTGTVRHLRTTYLREDELCFSYFEAPSARVLGEASERAAMAYERIIEAIDQGSTGEGVTRQ